MNPRRSSALLPSLAIFAASSAGAVVGPAHDGAAFSDRIVMVLSRGGEGSGFCTGVVLSPRIVLTAAHCLRPAADMLVHYRDAGGQPVGIAVAATAAHPLYRADAIARRVVSIDVGLIETATPLATAFQPAVLAEGDAPSIGEAATVVGYGLGEEGRPKTGGALRAAALRIREPASKILLWASDPEDGGAGACSGDSGGPIFAEDGKTVLAIVAWTSGGKGHKCGALTQGPLIAPLRGWIDKIVNRWGT
jgi:S1-C subfamily serine protease